MLGKGELGEGERRALLPPYCVCFAHVGADNLNPKFVRSFKLPYRFETQQRLRFVCYDIDDLKSGLEQQDFIGEAYCALSEIVTAPGQSINMPLQVGTRERGTRAALSGRVFSSLRARRRAAETSKCTSRRCRSPTWCAT